MPFNGGQSQVNFNDPQNGGDFPFLNLMKSGQGWSMVVSVSPFLIEPSTVDSNGYPTSIVGGSFGITNFFYVPLQSERAGNYVVKWTGNGTAWIASYDTAISYVITAASIASQCVLTCASGVGNNTFNLRIGQPITISGITGTGWNGTGINTTWQILAVNTGSRQITIGFNSGSLGAATLSGSSLATNTKTTTISGGLSNAGRYVFSTVGGGSNGFHVGVVSVNSSVDYPHDMICCHEDDEAAIDAGQTFGVKFKQRLVEANFGVYRFENWMQTVATCQMTNWWTRRPSTYAYYTGPELRASIYCGATSNSGNAYTASAPSIDSSTGAAWSGVLHDKTTVTVLFNASATQSGLCSLNVGGTGVKNILDAYSSPLSIGGNSYPIGGTSQSLAALIYDATLDAWIKQGGDAGENGVGLNNGLPPEVCFQLCKEMGAHPYFNAPVMSCDPATDYMSNLATYCQANAPSWMIPRFEGPNELWNSFPQFFQTTYANNKRLIFNGAKSVSGVVTNTTYSASAFVYPSPGLGAGNSDITLSTTGNSFVVGSYVNLAGFAGLNSLPSQGYVVAINVGSNANKITVNVVPSSGAYTSGGTVQPNAGDYNNWYGQTISVMGQACATVYNISNLGTKYWVLAGVQTGVGDNTITSNARLQSTSFVLNNSPQSPYTATAAYKWVTHVCCAQYMTPSDYGQAAETTLSAAFDAKQVFGSIASGVLTTTAVPIPGAGGVLVSDTIFGQNIPTSSGVTVLNISGSSPNLTITLSDNSINATANYFQFGTDMSAPKTYVDTLNSGGGSFILSALNTLYQNWFAFAHALTNNNGATLGLTGYEGGYSPDYTDAGFNALDIFRYAGKFVTSSPGSATGLQGYYTTNMNNFVNAGGVFPAEYQMSGKYPTNGVWQVLENIYQTPNPPQWLAIIAFNPALPTGQTLYRMRIQL